MGSRWGPTPEPIPCEDTWTSNLLLTQPCTLDTMIWPGDTGGTIWLPPPMSEPGRGHPKGRATFGVTKTPEWGFFFRAAHVASLDRRT